MRNAQCNAQVASGAHNTVKISSAPSSEKWPVGGQPGFDRADRAGAEDQRRDRQRHDQQDQQHAAAAQAQRQRRTHAAEQADRIGVPSSSEATSAASDRAAHAEQQADQRRRQQQRQRRSAASARPPWRRRSGCRGGRDSSICSSEPSAWSPAYRLATDSIDASSAQTQTTPGGDLAQHLRLGADAERKQADRDDEEDHRQQRLDTAPRGHAHVAAVDGGKDGSHALCEFSAPRRTRRGRRWSSAAPRRLQPGGWSAARCRRAPGVR